MEIKYLFTQASNKQEHYFQREIYLDVNKKPRDGMFLLLVRII